MSYARVNGLELYYEVHGAGAPLILLHGGLGTVSTLGPILPRLAEKRQVIAVELQGHGHTADIDRPLRFELLGEDLAALIQHLGLGKADVVGYSLGGSAALRATLQHPDLVNRLIVVASPFARQGWHPDVLAGMAQMGAAAVGPLKHSPLYQAYAAVAPRPGDFPALLDKVGDLLRQEYDWSREVAALKLPVMLAYADADSVRPAHMVEFFRLLGGGLKDAGWDGAGRPQARLAILPGHTHYNLFTSPALADGVVAFLG